MRVQGTYFTCKEDDIEELKRTEKLLNESIKNNPESVALYTDDDKCIGHSVRAWIEEDHIVIEYEADEAYKEEFEKEGFSYSL